MTPEVIMKLGEYALYAVVIIAFLTFMYKMGRLE